MALAVLFFCSAREARLKPSGNQLHCWLERGPLHGWLERELD
jgi:hypothetical protein